MVGEVILKYFLLVSTLSLTRDYICNLESSFTLCWGEKMGRILGGGNLLKNEKSGLAATDMPHVFSTL